MRFSDISLRAKLGATFAFFAACLVGLGAQGAFTSLRLSQDLDKTANLDLVEAEHAHKLRTSANMVARASRDLLLLDSAGALKRQREAIAGALRDGDATFGALAELMAQGEHQAIVDNVGATKERFKAAILRYLAILDTGNQDDARQALLIELRPVLAAYEDSVQKLMEQVALTARHRAIKGQGAARRATGITIGLVIAAVMVAALVGFTITRSITRRVNAARQFARAIRDGDLSTVAPASGRDELGEMLLDMKEMQSTLAQVLVDVRSASQQVAEGSAQIAGGNADLSSRTEHAASSLQQTALAVGQISGTLGGTSEMSRKGASVAGEARAAAIQGGEAVEQLTTTMGAIERESRRVNEIIGVIDSIAFQTNILALNASVEAARAGEQGRGFAVVASEVRALASRAAIAAKEIKTLIHNTTAQIAAGTQLADGTRSRIENVVAQVVTMEDIMKQISHAASEQVVGVGTVNGAMNQLDRSTQQNATLVQELAATTASLRGNASQLLASVQFFKLAQEAS